MIFVARYILVSYLLLTLYPSPVSCDPFAYSLAAGLFSAVGNLPGLSRLKCMAVECCTDRWIAPNFTALATTLRQSLHGQHLAIDPVLKHLKAHFKKQPSKALVLSFHGGTGTGKNFFSNIVAENLFRQGGKSKFVYLISATKDFPHEEMVSLYKDNLRDLIEKAVAECPRSFFILDEMDKMPKGLLDTLKPYLDYYENLRGVDYRKATFFFLSNTAGTQITEAAMKQWTDGNSRDSITLKEMEKVIHRPAYNSDSGLWHSELISKNLITAFIPFLPMERKHVKQCIVDALVAKGYYKSRDEVKEAVIQTVADELTYYPEGLGVYSATGCKRVHEKVDFIMEKI